MLLVHQAGHVRVGEVVRYTLTYTPSDDRILPSASSLQVRVKNTTAIPYRAAYLHGPYTLHVSTYPACFNPYQKLENPRRDGVPEFEPMLKAGGHFHSKLTVPEDMRLSGHHSSPQKSAKGQQKSVTWIIEIASQVLFSKNASVHYEILVGRDERSLDLGFAAIAGKGHGGPGQLQELLRAPANAADRKRSPQKGVYSPAVELSVEDTDQLWNKPALPTWDDIPGAKKESNSGDKTQTNQDRPQKKIHLVVLTHGIHSNVGADMLFLKESIDATVRQAREDQRAQRSRPTREEKNTGTEERAARRDGKSNDEPSTAPLSGGQEDIKEDTHADFDPEDEQVIVRGFSGNTTKTEKGIKYLGKRLAKYILTFTHPDQPFLPESKSIAKKLSIGPASRAASDPAAHPGSTIHESKSKNERLPYTFTSISFVGHSLGGLVQTYAVAYIQKHSPQFFQKITPVNFVCMASPMLGLSNENPLYVKFALDFGLVGRTGQDLGLTWRAPAIAKSGWASVLSSFGAGAGEDKPKEEDPGAKPLLRILPTGPAHQVLRMFRNRTTYSNVVNDGIVPLRTSCLLFLDWRGLNRVEAARRENGLLATMASVGWAELTGANAVSHRPLTSDGADQDFLEDAKSNRGNSADEEVGPKNETRHDSLRGQFSGPQPPSPQPSQALAKRPRAATPSGSTSSLTSNTSKKSTEATKPNGASPFAEFFNFFRPAPARKDSERSGKISSKVKRTYRRAQTIQQNITGEQMDAQKTSNESSDAAQRPTVTRGSSLVETEEGGPPPKTSVFDAAADILNPPIPSLSWLTDPSSRDRSIFHDRIYHPDDIPPPPPKKMKTTRSLSSDGLKRGASTDNGASRSTLESDVGSMRVEEKIARAYHHNLSWRKVLVRLEPDAHNNMIVRRMFANAYGWEVVKHVCDTHFSDSYAAQTSDAMESSRERAKAPDEPVGDDGAEINKEEQEKQKHARPPLHDRTRSELQESGDAVAELSQPHTQMNSSHPGTTGSASRRSSDSDARVPGPPRTDSAVWDDRIFEGSGSDSDSDDESNSPFGAIKKIWNGETKGAGHKDKGKGIHVDTDVVAETAGLSADPQIASFLTASPSRERDSEALSGTGTGNNGVVSSTYSSGLAVVGSSTADATATDAAKGKSEEEGLKQESEASTATRPRTSESTSTADVGLHKSVAESIGDAGAGANARPTSSGIAEDVARAAGAQGSGRGSVS